MIETKQEALARFARFGSCDHAEEFREKSEIPKTNIIIESCGICAKEFGRSYNV